MLSEQEVRDSLARLLPRRNTSTRSTTLGAGGYDIEAGRAYLAGTVDLGLALPTWPRRYGGRDASNAEARLIATVRREFAVPDIYPFGVGTRMVGPTLLEHGTVAQQDRWVRAIASGTEIWCQMFSEPEAGSDLANAATLAERVPEGWRLNGQKVWTSRAAYAQWGICLARTDPDAPKHRGLTMFAVLMATPGVEVRPLRQMNGDSHFSEVFLTDVVINDEDRIGAANNGWAVAVSVLAHERGGNDGGSPAPTPSRRPRWLADLVAEGSLNDPEIRDRAMRLYCYDEAVRFTRLRASASVRAGQRPGPEGSGMKLHMARSFKARVDLLATAAGPAATLDDWRSSVDFLTGPSMSIRGGTDEIQRNIVAERVLGLPPEIRADRDVSWSQSRRGVK
ncbi:MAG: Acyl-CoA dehydrogenase [Acidimicrobiia bacterium]|nr:Acyl-CoA dehydrogenase [Acidimicrobiia bacterium]